MTTQSIGLSPEAFASAFPWHLVLDHELRIAQAGPALLVELPDLAVGAALADVFALAPGQTPDGLAALAQQPGAQIALAAHTEPLRLQGRLLHDSVSGYLVVLADTPTASEPLGVPDLASASAKLGLAAQALETSEQHFRTLVTHAPVGIFETAASGSCQFVNQRWQEIMQISFEDALGDGWSRGLHPDDRARVYEAWTASVQQGLEFALDYRFLHPDGSVIWVAGKAIALYDEQGAIRCYLGTMTDITALKQAEAALAESEATLRSFYDNTPLLMGVVELSDDDLLFVSVNSLGASLFGHSQAEMRGQRLSSWLDPGQLDTWLAPCRECLSSGKSRTFEYQRQVGESTTWSKATVGPISASPSIRPRFAYVIEDITEQRLAEQALRATEAQYRTLIEQIPAIIYTADLSADSSTRYVSPQIEVILGFTPAEWLAKPKLWLEQIHPDDRAHVRDAVLKTQAGDATHACEYRALKRDGQIVWLRDTARIVYDHDGQPLCMQGITIDISERKQFEAALAAARDEALAASRLKSEFLATVSHEIRTPMNGIIGMTELLCATALDSEQRAFATIVHDSARALLAIINDILDFSKIEAGKLEIETAEVDLLAVVESSAELLAARARAQGLALLTFVTPELPRSLLGDAGRLRQVLLNLLGNAIKFTPSGGLIDVRADLERADTSTVLVRCSVRDTGIGIAEPVLNRLFKPFTQANSSVTRRYGGTGLGLAISKHLVELMGGTLEVSSTEGQGSIFSFTVHLARTPASAAPAAAPPPLRALIAHDDIPGSAHLQRTLAAWGMPADCVASSHAALLALRTAAAEGAPYNVVLTALALPDRDGFALAQAILAEPALGSPRLLLLAAFDERAQASQAHERGFAAALNEPIKQSQLLDALLGKPTPHDSPAKQPAAQPELRAALAVPPNSARILVVDDHEINQQLAQHQLASLGYMAEIAANGRQAIAAAAAQTFALILMDCQMPEVDGFAATRAIRASEAGGARRTPIVAITANVTAGIAEACFAAGMDGYLSKPVRSADLARVLEQFIPGSPAPQLPTPAPQASAGPLDLATIESIRQSASSPTDDLLSELIDLFLEHTPVQLTALRAAIAQGDTTQIVQMAHRLQGSSVTMGATELAACCAEVELLAERGRIEAVRDSLVLLEHALEQATQALQNLRRVPPQ